MNAQNKELQVLVFEAELEGHVICMPYAAVTRESLEYGTDIDEN
jgi:hypothetical protein